MIWTPTPLEGYHYLRLTAGVVVMILIYWILLPGPEDIRLESCEPKGPLAEMRAWAHGPVFWRAQLPSVEEDLAEAAGWDVAQAKANSITRDAIGRINASAEATYAQHPESAPSAAQRWADELRAKADDIEGAEQQRVLAEFMRKRAAQAERCRAKIIAAR